MTLIKYKRQQRAAERRKVKNAAQQLHNWKKEFLENAYRAFCVTKDEKEAKNLAKAAIEREGKLMAKVGQLTNRKRLAKKI